MRHPRLIGLVAAALVAVAAPAGTAAPVVHQAHVDGEVVRLHVRLPGTGVPSKEQIRVNVRRPSESQVRPSAVQPCPPADAVVIISRGKNAPAGAGAGDLDDARAAVREALRGIEGAQVAMIVAGDGSDAVTLTDLGAATESVKALGEVVDIASVKDALQRASRRLGSTKSRRRVIVVVTSGALKLNTLDRELADLIGTGIELYEIALEKDVSSDPLAGRGVVEQASSWAQAGGLLRASIDRCHVVEVALRDLPGGQVELAVFAEGGAGLARSVLLPARAPSGDDGGTPWWVWVLIGAVPMLLIAGGIVLFGLRPRKRHVDVVYTPVLGPTQVQDGGVRIVVATSVRPFAAVGKTRPLDPVRLAGPPEKTAAQPPAPGLAAWLVVYRNGVPTDTLVLQTLGVTTIGRDPDRSIRLDDETVSKQHARITAQAGRFFLDDEGSTHGTMVAGQRISTRVPLEDGVFITLGQSRLRFKSTR